MNPMYNTVKLIKDKIEDPAHWTQKVNARDIRGNEVSALSTSAVCWCVNGAVVTVLADGWDMTEVLMFLSRSVPSNDSLIAVNDKGGHKAIMDVLNRALAILALATTRP